MGFWARVRGWWSGSGDSGPTRLIDIPGQSREPSAALLERLRALDPRAEVLYVGAGRWWVGRVKRDVPRIERGRRMATRLLTCDTYQYDDWWPAYRQALLMAQGFGLVVDETIQGEPDGILVREFEKALYVERGGQLETDATRAEQARQDRLKANQDRERQLYRWLHARSPHGRGNPMVGAGSNQPTGRLL